jgi:F0F1-type ATP synthase epsilon subunit
MPKRTLASTGEIVDIERKDMTEAQRSTADENAGKPTMTVKVYAPFQVYFEGTAYSLTAVNETGPFDILPHHHNFLCMLVPCDLKIVTPEETKTVKISRALMHVKAEEVTVFVDV